jgi:hypothetical protein
MPDERYKGAYEAALDDVAKAQAVLVDKQKVANMMATAYGVEPPFKDVDAPKLTVAAFTIKPDQFANFSAPSEAARAFLKMRHEAVDLETILDGLRKGGFAFSTSKGEQANGLAKALGKDQLVRRLSSGAYGLWEWYPKAKRDRDAKKGPGEKDDESIDEGSGESPAPPSVEPTPVQPDESEKKEVSK